MRREIQQVQAASYEERICRSEDVWDQEGVWPGGGGGFTALAPSVLRLGSVTSGWRRGRRGGGDGGQ